MGISALNFDVDSNELSHEIRAVLNIPAQELLLRARTRIDTLDLSFAGLLYPPEAWALFQSGQAQLIDVRTIEERRFVGYVPQTPHVAWKIGAALNANPHFLEEFEKLVPDKNAAVLLLCRSGKRSFDAAQALAEAGYANAFNVLEGFEGELNNDGQRGEHDGWRHWGLPWIQD